MGCKDCSDKTSRYGGLKMDAGDIDTQAPPQGTPKGNPAASGMAQPTDPMSIFLSAKAYSYVELKERQEFSRRAAIQQADHIMKEMTDAMRQVHLEELIATANSDIMSIPGMTSDQAIVSIKMSLDRPDFEYVTTLYPGLKEAIELRHATIIANALPGRKDV
jgi:hypothetical protein